MAGSKTRHRVKATMIVAKVPGAQGGEVYLRQGAVLPESVTNDEIKRLSTLGLIERFTVDEPTGNDDGNQTPAA
ncbi:hypothetical protein LJR045_000981 [Microbacterium sp. LjRoot45]|uniref:hypothetical protein n=1 Tax=Microbacterium sp. LjRoot45 TaxID=3342329 RepID=UPI003ECD3615